MNRRTLSCALVALTCALSGCSSDDTQPGDDAESDVAEDTVDDDVGGDTDPGRDIGRDVRRDVDRDQTSDPGSDPTTDPGTADADAGSDTGDVGEDTDAGVPLTCGNGDPLRQPFFGDTHVHTSWSFDSFLNANFCNGPAEAFAFARGGEVELGPVDPITCQSIRTDEGWDSIAMRRPLDFVAVTDHAEFIGMVNLCRYWEDDPGYDTPYDPRPLSLGCQTMRDAIDGDDPPLSGILAGGMFAPVLESLMPTYPPEICEEVPRVGVPDCQGATDDAWWQAQAAANAADDPCEFTAFIGYEYSGLPGGYMTHHNVVYRGSDVPSNTISYIQAPTGDALRSLLRSQCIENGDLDCDVLTIAHNPNFSAGNLFADTSGGGSGTMTAEQARMRADMEPLMEIMQIKGQSERFGAFSDDEGCDFEIMERRPVCTGTNDPEGCLPDCGDGWATDEAGDCSSRYDWFRGIVGLGLQVEREVGANPYAIGVVGSTDTHNASPGATDEDLYYGHSGGTDSTPGKATDMKLELGDFDAGTWNPGGLAVVWAEENTRASIFDAMRRRETYATSGNRPVLRVFGAHDLDPAMCDRSDFAAYGYAQGVPMGGTLAGGTAPSFGVWATADPDICPPGETCSEVLTSANYLQRVQMVKVWVDTSGDVHEQVWDIACANGTPVNGRCPAFDDSALIDADTCEFDVGAGAAEMCTVWTDPDYDASQYASYYVRVLENPVCRWSAHVCDRWFDTSGQDCDAWNEDAEDPDAFRACCIQPRTVQERAWSSPIFVSP